ncbi:MAG TPA: Wzz/FepE/Etk N-terminal domain-containing protein, partial [Lacipirellulaceae bacterium]
MHRHANELPAAAPNGAINPVDFIRILRAHVGWWLAPAVVCGVLAAAYSLVAPRTWQATQSLIIRPEAAGVSEEQMGKFSDLSEMKTLQETILELAKSQSVVQESLREVGPPRGYRRPEQWPTPMDVEELRDS